MKLIRKNIYKMSILAMALSLVGCKDFLDINENPNKPLEVPAQTLLSTGLIGSAFANQNELNRFASTIMSVTTGVAGNPASYDRYIVDGSNFGNQWNFELYGGALINYKKLIEVSKVNGPAYSGVAKIMLAYTMGATSDIWGDVPYSEALAGDKEILTPKIDLQKDIYLGNSASNIQSLFDLVKEGLADLDKESIISPGTEDMVYAGDLSKWKRAGNSILLKLATQISLVDPARAKTEINAVIASKSYIIGNDQNLAVNYGTQVGSQSPTWVLTNLSSFRTEWMISTRFVNLLKSTNDPRLPLYVTKPTGDYVTADNGFGGVFPVFANRSKFNAFATGKSGEGPSRLVTYAQTCFNLAEAVIRLGVSGDAQALFQEGIKASMKDAGVSDTDLATFFSANGPTVTLSGTNEHKYEQIITQKYIAQFSNGLEQWNDWRRTGYPVLAPHQNAGGIDGTRPVRAVYLSTEAQRNPNFPQGTAIPQSNVKVWWDVN